MRAVLVVCFFLIIAFLDASAKNKKKSSQRIRGRKTIWSSIRRNAADIKRLTFAIKETQQLQQEFGQEINTLKENVDDMKEGFLSMPLMMAQMKTSINEMKGDIENLQKDIGTEEGSGSPPGIYAEYRARPSIRLEKTPLFRYSKVS